MRGRVPWYTIAGIGNEGCEILLSTQDKIEAEKQYPLIELRTRFNTHRNIRLYAYLSSEKVTWDHFDDPKYMSDVVRRKSIF